MSSFNEVRLEVVKMEDVGSGRKFVTSSFESFGKGKEKKRVRSSPSLDRKICNRIDEVVDRDLGSRAFRMRSNWWVVPLKSS